MKKTICLMLSLALVFALAACSGMPAFHSDDLTEAQSYASAALSNYKLSSGYELKSVKVLLTDDLAADLKEVGFDKWNVSAVTAAVVAKADKPSSTGEDTATASDATASDASSSAKPESTERTLIFLLNAEKEVIFTSDKLPAADDSADTPSDGSVISGDDADIDGLRRTLASTELLQEKLVEENTPKDDDKPEVKKAAEDFVAFITEAEPKLADEAYGYSAEYLNAIKDNDALEEWDGYVRECARLENRIAVMEKISKLSEEEQTAALKLLDSDEEVATQMLKFYSALRQVEAQLDTLSSENANALEPIIARLEEIKTKQDYLYDEDYLKLCLTGATLSENDPATKSGENSGSNTVGNSYDVLIRQKYVYDRSIAALEDCKKTKDLKQRSYIIERCSLENDGFTAYTNQFKVYIQCVLNLEGFKTENAAAIEDYETSLAAAKKAAGSDYEDDIDYIKVGVKYEELNKQLSAYENAVSASKEDADGIKADYDKQLETLDSEESERISDIDVGAEKKVLVQLLSGELTSVSEYEALKGQWGDLNPGFAAYINAGGDSATSGDEESTVETGNKALNDYIKDLKRGR